MNLIVTDIDGTLVNDEKVITPLTKERLLSRKKQGDRIVVATGRIHGAGRVIAAQLGRDAFLISSNGALIKNMLTEEILYEKRIPQDVAEQVIRFYRNLGIYFHIYTEVGLYSEFHERLAPYYLSMQDTLPDDLKFHVEIVDNSWEAVKGQKIYKIGCWSHDPSVMREVYDFLEDKEGITAYKSHDILFDVMAEGVSKAEGIKAIMKYYGIEQHVYAFGDNDNDAEMIAFADHGIAMANASVKAKQAADFITLDNNSDGIVHALNHFMQF